MEAEIQATLQQFMASPLVTWVKTFGELGDKGSNMFSQYTELVDGDFLTKVMNQINPKGTVQGLNKVRNDVGQRAQNLSVLSYHIKTYYQENLRQLVMVPPPNVLLLNRNPACEEGVEEMNRLLLLLLGCAVQCERKEEYIKNIQSLDFDTKAAIAAHIQEVTHCQENVFDLQWLEMEGLCPEEWASLCRNMTVNLKMLVEQRDRQFEIMVGLMQGDERVESAAFRGNPSLTESSGCQLPLSQQHLALELTDAKAKIKRLRQELEEKSEQLLDSRQDLDNMEAELKRLQQENMQLLTDARAARMYRDELDAVKERAIRADKLESEVKRYREKLHNMNFYKLKLEELKEDNQVLMESKVMLEEQLQSIRARSDRLHHLEKHNLLLEAKLHDMEEERTVERRLMEEMMEKNVALELSQRRSMEESQRLGWELEQLGKNPQQSSGTELNSLDQEVTERLCSRLLKLEKENQKLRKTLEEKDNNNKQEQDHQRFHTVDAECMENGEMDLADCKTSESSPGFGSSNNRPEITQTQKTSDQSGDTNHQHLHVSLENGNYEFQSLESQLHELEMENQDLVQENGHLEREKTVLKKETQRLQQQLKICSMVKNTNCLTEVCANNKDLEKDNEELLQPDQRMLTTLREEALDQKLKTQQKENDLEKLIHEVERLRLKQKMCMEDQEPVEQSECKQLESEMESSLIKSLKTRLEESSKINRQLQQDLKTVKQNYETLLQRQEEEEADQSSQSERSWQRETQKATWALLNVKDQLIEVERNNATLLAEKQALHTQLQSLQMQSEGLQAQIVALQQQTASLQESNTTLQTHNAQLQVEKSTVSTQNASLVAHNAQLQRQCQTCEGEREGAVREREDLRTVNELLLRDHERLSILHERQAAELEVLSHRYSTLESSHRTLEIEHRSLEDRYDTLLQQRAQLEGLEKALREQQQKMQNEICTHRNTTAECQRLRDEKEWLNQTYQKLLAENEGLQTEHTNMKSQLNSSKLEQKQLESEMSKLKEQNQQLDIATIKLSHQCELLTQLKGNLEEENRHLLDQIQSLMLQNRTLLDQTMESKDLFHVEQRQYIDKLNELRRQKEKLEEKIMDQYKFYDPSPPRRRGNWITLRMKKLIKTRNREQEPAQSSSPPPRSESCEGLENLRCCDNSSFNGSEESASNSLSGDAAPLKKSSSEYDLKRSPSNKERAETAHPVSCKPFVPTPKSQVIPLKMFHVKRNRPKEKDKVKSLFRRSLSMNDLLQTEECLDGDSKLLEEQPDEKILHHSIRTSSSSSSSSVHHYCSTDCHKTIQHQGKDLHKETIPPGVSNGTEDQNHGSNGRSSRAPSASSGEFSLSLENEAWSSDSSLHPDSLSYRNHRSNDSSPPAGPHHEESCSTGRGVQRSSSGRSSGDRCFHMMDKTGVGLYKTQSVQSTEADPKLALDAQGKSSSVSGCLNCFATPMRSPRTGQALTSLPRASCVISTSEGNSRRASVNSTTSRKSVASLSSRNGAETQTPPLVSGDGGSKETSDLKEEDRKPEQIFDSEFTIDSVFTNTIFSESS